jgi:hypothetical protein
MQYGVIEGLNASEARLWPAASQAVATATVRRPGLLNRPSRPLAMQERPRTSALVVALSRSCRDVLFVAELLNWRAQKLFFGSRAEPASLGKKACVFWLCARRSSPVL